MCLPSREVGQERMEVCRLIGRTESRGANMRKAEGIHKDSVTGAVIDQSAGGTEDWCVLFSTKFCSHTFQKKCRVIICLAKDIEMRSQAQLTLDPPTVWSSLLWGCLRGKTGQANPQTILGSPRPLYPQGPSSDLESSNMQASRLNDYLPDSSMC